MSHSEKAPETKPVFPITDRVREALAITQRGVEELLPENEWTQKLARSEATGVPLRIKLGLDPTAPDIHLGHTVVLNKLRQLQDIGHTVIFLIGDFTSLIGDPSGRNTTRPPLTAEQVKANAETYYKQASLVLDPARTGANQLHMILTDPAGRPVDVPEVDLEFTLRSRRIGPLTVPLTHAGTGEWTASALQLPVPGRWQVALTVRTSDIDEVTETGTVTIEQG